MRSLHHLQSKNTKATGNKTISSQQASFELRQRVFLALSKLADRDTHQIGVEELDRTIDGLGPEGIASFLSCIADTDAEQKSAVRKECVRMMGTLARHHGSLMAPYLGKMINSISKRLRDQDTVVRDACAETVGLLASHLGGCTHGDAGGAIVALSKPLFEALGEQNRNVQTGAAMCLARVFDEARDVPIPFLPQMLTRIIKLLKNPHFLAKPSLIDLIRSIIQAGGASAVQTLTLAVSSIQEALKSSEWTTRKAAAMALLEIAEGADLLSGALFPLKASSIQFLERCRFDKVKPVRDAAVHALTSWKSIRGLDSQAASETAALTKENTNREDYPEAMSAWKDALFKKVGATKRSPLSVEKSCQNTAQGQLSSRSNDWRVEISLPKNRIFTPAETFHEDSEGSCVTKSVERKSRNVTPRPGYQQGYDELDDDDDDDDDHDDDNDQECSATSDPVNMGVETKDVIITPDCIEECGSVNAPRGKHRFSADVEPREVGLCGLSSSAELNLIRKQLLDMERRQSSLMDLMQSFTRNTADALSTLQSKVNGLEVTVDKIAQNFPAARSSVNGPRSKLSPDGGTVNSSPRSCSSTSRHVAAGRWSSSKKEGFCSEGIRARKSGSGISDGRSSVWMRVKEMARTGDVDAAYAEAIDSGDDVVLMELMDRTGPVLGSLSPQTATCILFALSVCVRDGRYLHLAIPWLQQVADLSAESEHGGGHLARKAKKQLLVALHDAAAMDCGERAALEQISSRLRRTWCRRGEGDDRVPQRTTKELRA